MRNALQQALISQGFGRGVGKVLAQEIPVSMSQKGFILSFDIGRDDVTSGIQVITPSAPGKNACVPQEVRTEKFEGVQVDLESLVRFTAVQGMNVVRNPGVDFHRLYVNLEPRNPDDKNANAWMEGCYGKLFRKCCKRSWNRARLRSEAEVKPPGVTLSRGWTFDTPAYLLIFT